MLRYGSVATETRDVDHLKTVDLPVQLNIDDRVGPCQQQHTEDERVLLLSLPTVTIIRQLDQGQVFEPPNSTNCWLVFEFPEGSKKGQCFSE
jgi:hypothetical protein